MSSPEPIPFRQQALDQLLGPAEHEGALLHLSPLWAESAFWLLLLLVGAGLAFATVATVPEYASGPAVLQLDGRTELTAAQPGVVSAVEVHPGMRVEPGQVLLRFYGEQEQAELTRLDQEFELQLMQRLRMPSDPSTGQALATLRAQRDLAAARLSQRELRATHAGEVVDLRVLPGQSVAAGARLLTVRVPSRHAYVLTLLPGRYRPLLRRGSTLRLELEGFPQAYRELSVDAVSEEIIGPSEARRFLGAELADAVVLDGPVVLVQAHLPSTTFQFGGDAFAYHQGMRGTAEVRVRSERLLLRLLPGLQALWHEGAPSDER